MSLPPLSRAVVNRAAHRRADADWLRSAWGSPRARVLALGPDGGAEVAGTQLRWRPATDFSDIPVDDVPTAVAFLGSDGQHEYFGVSGPSGGTGLRELVGVLPDQDAGLLVHAVALAGWHRTHVYCPRCGTPTQPILAGHARQCPHDASTHFPRTDPAVIMLVLDPAGRRAVLGRQPSWPPGRFSCLAGFVEAGESAEAAVRREVAEEVGLSVRSVHWRVSQPWPFPASLMLAFTAVAEADPIVLGDGELAEAGWFDRDEARELLLPPSASVAHLLVSEWLTGAAHH